MTTQYISRDAMISKIGFMMEHRPDLARMVLEGVPFSPHVEGNGERISYRVFGAGNVDRAAPDNPVRSVAPAARPATAPQVITPPPTVPASSTRPILKSGDDLLASVQRQMQMTSDQQVQDEIGKLLAEHASRPTVPASSTRPILKSGDELLSRVLKEIT